MLQRLSLLLYGATALLTLLLFVGGDALPWGPLALLGVAALGAATVLRAHHALRAGEAWWWGTALRDEDPAHFWLAVGLTYLVGAACLASSLVLAVVSS